MESTIVRYLMQCNFIEQYTLECTQQTLVSVTIDLSRPVSFLELDIYNNIIHNSMQPADIVHVNQFC